MKNRKISQSAFPIMLIAIVTLFLLRVSGGSIWPFLPASLNQAAKLYSVPFEIMSLMSKNPSPPTSNATNLTITPTSGSKNSLMLGWILDTGASAITGVVNQTPGLNVLSPKWFHVDGRNGAIAGTPERTVIDQAHAKHLQVWGVVDNGFNGTLSHSILRYQDQQDMLIKHIVKLAVVNHLDGINLDFEGLLPQDRWNYSRFVTVLASKLHANHIKLSIDLPPDYVSGINTGPYNHLALAKAADYIILMGYDEYWLGDPNAGPTASLPWVHLAVNDFLQTGIPAKKLILGIPFYSEDWTMTKQGKVLSSVALSTSESSRLVSQLHSRLVWNAKEGVYFTTYQSQGKWHEIWLEDHRTLMLFAELARNDHLAGIATWYLGLESQSTWLSVLHTLHSPIVSN